MKSKKEFVVGVLGVATYATINFFEQWAKVFPAEKEWDRPRIIIDNNCTMPSRVRALLYNENVELLVEEMTASIKMLIQAGAVKILIACNTAHVFLNKVYQKYPSAQDYVVNIIDNCAEHLSRQNVKKFFLLASEGTILTGIYQKKLSAHGIECSTPPPEDFFMLRNFIEAVKQDKCTEELKDAFVNLIRQNVDSGGGVILGCTELPVLYDKCKDKFTDINFYDPMLLVLEHLKREFDDLPSND